MRVLCAYISDFKNFEGTLSVPTTGLVVLLGPNSSGKTNTMEAVGTLLKSAAGRVRRELGDDPRDDALGGVLFELDQVDGPGPSDASLYQRLISGEPDQGLGGFAFLTDIDSDDDDTELPDAPEREVDRLDPVLLPQDEASGLRDWEPAKIRDYLTERLIGDPADPQSGGTPPDRALLARHLAGTALFTWNGHGTLLVAATDRLPRKAKRAAARIAATSHRPGDRLHWHAACIAAGQEVILLGETAGLQVEVDDSYNPMPELVVLQTEPGGLADELRAQVDSLHWHMWLLNAIPGEMEVGGRTIPASTRDEDDWFPHVVNPVIDPWLEQRDLDQPRRAEWGSGWWASGEWSRIKPSLLATARRLAEHATDLAPSFVKDLGTIDIELLPPSLWAQVPVRLRISFVERHSGERRELASLGAGVARWVAASLRRAARELHATRREVLDEHGQVVEDPRAANAILKEVRRTVSDHLPMRLVPDLQARPLPLYVVDEPEAHLHPQAARSVRDWLLQLADPASANGVLVATHDASFFELGAEEASFLLLRRSGPKATLQPLPDDLWTRVDLLGKEMGFSRADLLQYTRVAVLVEGQHDVAALQGFFGDELARHMIRLVPVRGVDNVRAVLSTSLLEDISARQVVLRDRARSHATAWLPGAVEVIALDEHDITEYLHDEVCRAAAPQFPGWATARLEWKAAGRTGDLKQWCWAQYGLRLDERTIASLAAETRQAHGTPNELQCLLDRLKALARSP